MKTKSESQIPKRNLICYPVGTFGRDMANSMFTGYLLTYILFTRTLTTQQFAVINMFIVAARIFDGFNDPIMGAIVDATRTKWGKFKPWIFIGMLTSGIIIYAAFATNLQGWGFVFFIGVLYILYSVFFTMNDISYWGMLPSLARKSSNRNLLTSLTTICASAGGAILGAVVPTFTAGKLVIGGNALTAYNILAAVFVLLFFAVQSVTLVGVKENPLPPKQAGEKFSFKRIVKVISHNDQLLWAALILFFYTLSVGLAALQTTFIYFSFGYNGVLTLIFGGIAGIAAGGAMLFFAPLSKKFTRRQLMGAAVTCSIIGYVCVLLSGLFLGGNKKLQFVVMAAFMMIANLGPQIIYLIAMLCISNSIEYNEWKTGRRDEGIISAVRPFITKVGLALGQLLVTAIYLLLSVTQHTNQISEFENMASRGLIDEAAKTESISSVINVIPQSTTTALLACMTLIPAGLILVSYLIFRFKYKITEEKYEEILTELDAGKEESCVSEGIEKTEV